SSPNWVSIFLGNGDGTFQAARPFAAGDGTNFVAVGDFNSDGIEDLVTTHYVESFGQVLVHEVRVFLGKGDGTFRAAGIYPAIGPGSVAVGDFKGDGILDLAVANAQQAPPRGTLSIFLGKGDGSFQAAQNYAVGSHLTSLAVADLNGDGHLDLAV